VGAFLCISGGKRAHPDLWLLLVGERGWTPEAYEQWFGDTACDQLLSAKRRRT